MIRFDTFRFDYDTKNVIVFSRAVVVLLVRHALQPTSDCEKTSPSVYKNKYKKEDEQIFLH